MVNSLSTSRRRSTSIASTARTSVPEPRQEARLPVKSDHSKYHEEAEIIDGKDGRGTPAVLIHAGSRSERLPPFSARLGKLALWAMIVGTVMMLGILGFWSFLWHSDNTNAVWHYIMAGDHIKVIVTSTSEVIKRLLGLMIGAECSMIVALALESGQVFLPGMASAATGRRGLGAGKWFSPMRKMIKGKWPTTGSKFGLPILLVGVTLMDLISLGTDTILISDINLGQIATRSKVQNVSFGFQYQPDTITSSTNLKSLLYRGSSWGRKATSYAAFAEYSEHPAIQEGTSDTGLTLRAFLPFSNTSQRAQLHSYSGRTTVVDTRVTCQVPRFSNLTVDVQYQALIFSGLVWAERRTPRIGNMTMINAYAFEPEWHRNVAVPFLCTAPLLEGQDGDLSDQWRTSLCQLPESLNDGAGVAGGLVSEFENYTLWLQEARTYNESYHYGTAYLIFNVSSGVEYLWQELYGGSRYSERLPQYLPNHRGNSVGEWLSFNLEEGLGFQSTLCYSAFDQADLPVTITTTTGRNTTEPLPQFDFDSLKYSFGGIRKQYGQGAAQHGGREPADLESIHDARGVLSLQPQSWLAGPYVQPPIEPYLRQFVNMAGPEDNGNTPGWSAFLSDAAAFYPGVTWNISWYQENLNGESAINILQPDPMHVWFFQEIVGRGGSVAFAIQSLITLLSSMAYYDQIGQFDNIDAVEVSAFRTTNVPTRWRGWLAVTIHLVLHLVLSWVVLYWFVQGTKYTLLGESWQGLAQAVTAETMPYLEKATEMNDDEVKEQMTRDGLKKRRVKLGPRGKHGRVAIYLVEDEDEERKSDDEDWPGYTRNGKPSRFAASYRPVDESGYGKWPQFSFVWKNGDSRASSR